MSESHPRHIMNVGAALPPRRRSQLRFTASSPAPLHRPEEEEAKRALHRYSHSGGASSITASSHSHVGARSSEMSHPRSSSEADSDAAARVTSVASGDESSTDAHYARQELAATSAARSSSPSSSSSSSLLLSSSSTSSTAQGLRGRAQAQHSGAYTSHRGGAEFAPRPPPLQQSLYPVGPNTTAATAIMGRSSVGSAGQKHQPRTVPLGEEFDENGTSGSPLMFEHTQRNLHTGMNSIGTETSELHQEPRSLMAGQIGGATPRLGDAMPLRAPLTMPDPPLDRDPRGFLLPPEYTLPPNSTLQHPPDLVSDGLVEARDPLLSTLHTEWSSVVSCSVSSSSRPPRPRSGTPFGNSIGASSGHHRGHHIHHPDGESVETKADVAWDRGREDGAGSGYGSQQLQNQYGSPSPSPGTAPSLPPTFFPLTEAERQQVRLWYKRYIDEVTTACDGCLMRLLEKLDTVGVLASTHSTPAGGAALPQLRQKQQMTRLEHCLGIPTTELAGGTCGCECKCGADCGGLCCRDCVNAGGGRVLTQSEVMSLASHVKFAKVASEFEEERMADEGGGGSPRGVPGVADYRRAHSAKSLLPASAALPHYGDGSAAARDYRGSDFLASVEDTVPQAHGFPVTSPLVNSTVAEIDHRSGAARPRPPNHHHRRGHSGSSSQLRARPSPTLLPPSTSKPQHSIRSPVQRYEWTGGAPWPEGKPRGTPLPPPPAPPAPPLNTPSHEEWQTLQLRAFNELLLDEVTDSTSTVLITSFLKVLHTFELTVDLRPFHGIEIDAELDGTMTLEEFMWLTDHVRLLRGDRPLLEVTTDRKSQRGTSTMNASVSSSVVSTPVRTMRRESVGSIRSFSSGFAGPAPRSTASLRGSLAASPSVASLASSINSVTRPQQWDAEYPAMTAASALAALCRALRSLSRHQRATLVGSGGALGPSFHHESQGTPNSVVHSRNESVRSSGGGSSNASSKHKHSSRGSSVHDGDEAARRPIGASQHSDKPAIKRTVKALSPRECSQKRTEQERVCTGTDKQVPKRKDVRGEPKYTLRRTGQQRYDHLSWRGSRPTSSFPFSHPGFAGVPSPYQPQPQHYTLHQPPRPRPRPRRPASAPVPVGSSQSSSAAAATAAAVARPHSVLPAPSASCGPTSSQSFVSAARPRRTSAMVLRDSSVYGLLGLPGGGPGTPYLSPTRTPAGTSRPRGGFSWEDYFWQRPWNSSTKLHDADDGGAGAGRAGRDGRLSCRNGARATDEAVRRTSASLLGRSSVTDTHGSAKGASVDRATPVALAPSRPTNTQPRLPRTSASGPAAAVPAARACRAAAAMTTRAKHSGNRRKRKSSSVSKRTAKHLSPPVLEGPPELTSACAAVTGENDNLGDSAHVLSEVLNKPKVQLQCNLRALYDERAQLQAMLASRPMARSSVPSSSSPPPLGVVARLRDRISVVDNHIAVYLQALGSLGDGGDEGVQGTEQAAPVRPSQCQTLRRTPPDAAGKLAATSGTQRSGDEEGSVGRGPCRDGSTDRGGIQPSNRRLFAQPPSPSSTPEDLRQSRFFRTRAAAMAARAAVEAAVSSLNANSVSPVAVDENNTSAGVVTQQHLLSPAATRVTAIRGASSPLSQPSAAAATALASEESVTDATLPHACTDGSATPNKQGCVSPLMDAPSALADAFLNRVTQDGDSRHNINTATTTTTVTASPSDNNGNLKSGAEGDHSSEVPVALASVDPPHPSIVITAGPGDLQQSGHSEFAVGDGVHDREPLPPSEGRPAQQNKVDSATPKRVLGSSSGTTSQPYSQSYSHSQTALWMLGSRELNGTNSAAHFSGSTGRPQGRAGSTGREDFIGSLADCGLSNLMPPLDLMLQSGNTTVTTETVHRGVESLSRSMPGVTAGGDFTMSATGGFPSNFFTAKESIHK